VNEKNDSYKNDKMKGRTNLKDISLKKINEKLSSCKDNGLNKEFKMTINLVNESKEDKIT